VYFNSYKIIGTPRGYPCWIYNKKPLVKPPVEIPQHHYCNAKPAPSQDFKTHSIVAQKQDEHFNAPPVTLKDLTPTSLTQPSDQIAPEHVHPDRLRNFIHPTVSPQATSTYTSEIDSYPQSRVYKIPQRSKIKKKQFLGLPQATSVNALPLGTRHATSANAIPLGAHRKNEHPRNRNHDGDSDMVSPISNPVSEKEILVPQEMADSSNTAKAAMESQNALALPTNININNNNNILNRATRMAASMFSMNC